MKKSKELLDLEKQIQSNPKNFDVNICIEFLKEHEEEAENLGKFFFEIESNVYELNYTNRKIVSEIILSLPSVLESLLKPLLLKPDSEFKSNSHYILDEHIQTVKNAYIKKANRTYEQLSQLLSKIITGPTYTIISKRFLQDDSKLREHYEKLNPTIYKLIDDQEARLTNIITQFKKKCYIPRVEHRDSIDPRVSKFGGSAPYLPNEGPITCPCGCDKLQLVFSLYVPSIPLQMRSLFPAHHEYVVAGYTCNSCYDSLKVVLYADDQIDRLVYDSVPGADELFNEARTVVEWVEGVKYPDGTVDSGFDLPDRGSYGEDELVRIDELLMNTFKSEERTYLGGYPVFVQGDDSPPAHELLLEMEESEASTSMWGDCGTCQVWMTTGEDFGSFVMQYACC